MSKALKPAQREAEAAFGVGDVYIEKYIEHPRHIEFQILGDHHGDVIHLGERECSIQRRHQKLVEEGPSVAVTEKMRRKLGASVVEAAGRCIHQRRHDRVPDGRQGQVLLPRSQHPHPGRTSGHGGVTGVDIVKEQIRIAAGERLSFRQGDVHSPVTPSSAASTPKIPTRSALARHDSRVQPPGGPGVRDRHVRPPDCTIPPYYDSMIAKIIAHGRDRHEAIARMRRTLKMTVIEGIKTSIPLHLKI